MVCAHLALINFEVFAVSRYLHFQRHCLLEVFSRVFLEELRCCCRPCEINRGAFPDSVVQVSSSTFSGPRLCYVPLLGLTLPDLVALLRWQ